MFGYKRSTYSGRPWYGAGKKIKSTTGKALFNARTQKTGSKNVYYNCTVENIGVSIPFTEQGNEKGTYTITPMITDQRIANKSNMAPMARLSPLGDIQFRSMCHSYDQCRIISMKVTLQITPGTSNMVAPCTLFTLWNRSASSTEVGLGNAMVDSDGVPPISQLRGTGSTISTPLGGYQKYQVTRSIYPKDAQEKMTWWDCDIIYLGTAGSSPTDVMYFKDWYNGSTSVTNHAFMPCLYWGLQRAITGVGETWYANIRVEYNFAFRNQCSKLGLFAQYNTPGYVNPEGAKGVDVFELAKRKKEDKTIKDQEEESIEDTQKDKTEEELV